jgi:hypothetical protein
VARAAEAASAQGTFTDPRLCAAIVDRLTFGGNIIETGTDSGRLAAQQSEPGTAMPQTCLYRWRGDEIRARVTSSLAARDDSLRRSSGGARCETRARETARWS